MGRALERFQEPKFMRIVIAGGGTGGHVIPALAIAQQLKRQFGAEVLFIGTARGIETRLVPQAGFSLELIQIGALKYVSLMTRLLRGCYRSSILKL
jgi:UDP-N-acetylglucosamine--N-acetylmuramyl-(pentapeptide) pyrophosphoryl-undecaprenol N-acetylglucosamine transferase